MRQLINVVFLVLTTFIFSCASNRKLIGKSPTEFGSIKFYVVNATNGKTNVDKIYADVDSGNIKRFYSFYPDRIVMTDERAKNLSYTVMFQRLPANYDTNIYQRFSKLDTIVFDKAKSLLDAFNYSNLKKLQGAEGYLIEINYYHGFPKNKKFEPL